MSTSPNISQTGRDVERIRNEADNQRQAFVWCNENHPKQAFTSNKMYSTNLIIWYRQSQASNRTFRCHKFN